MTVKLRFFIYITLLAIGFAGCKQDEECAPAYVDYIIIPADSLSFGNWEWIYTLKYARTNPSELFQVVDTIFPGDSETGFETIHFANGSITKAEICFDISGSLVSGCYTYWSSRLYPAVEPTYVRTIFYEWKTPENQSLVLEPRFPTEPDNIVLARTLGLPMFEVSEQVADTLFYRNWFVKVD